MITPHRRDVRDGIRDALPVIFAVLPFAAVFGALANDSGFSLSETMLASGLIYAGASQYVMLDLRGQQASAWLIVLAIFAVNFRHVLYSASIGRHLQAFTGWQKALALFLLVDPQSAAGEERAATSGLRPAYYFSYAAVIYGVWMVGNVIGALFGNLIEDPAVFGFDFILLLYFTGLIVGFRTRPNFFWVLLASVLASLLAFWTVGSPWHISIGGGVGLLVAAMLVNPDRQQEPPDGERHV